MLTLVSPSLVPALCVCVCVVLKAGAGVYTCIKCPQHTHIHTHTHTYTHTYGQTVHNARAHLPRHLQGQHRSVWVLGVRKCRPRRCSHSCPKCTCRTPWSRLQKKTPTKQQQNTNSGPVNVYVCLYACVCMCMYVYVCVCMCVYVCVCVCVYYVCMYACVSVCVCVRGSKQNNNNNNNKNVIDTNNVSRSEIVVSASTYDTRDNLRHA